jgi:hypothetical protein
MASRLREALARERLLWEQKRRIAALEAELERLRAHNERMRTGMRRCVTCEYRIESEARRS